MLLALLQAECDEQGYFSSTMTVPRLFALLHRNQPDETKQLLDSVNSKEQLGGFLATQNLLGDSPLHTAVYKKNKKSLRYLVGGVEPQQRLSIFLIRNSSGLTPLDEAVDLRSVEITRYILESLPSDEDRFCLLKSQNDRCRTAVHRAVIATQKDIVKILLESVNAAYRLALVDETNSSFLLRSLLLPDLDIFKTIIETLGENNRVAVLKLGNNGDGSILHTIVVRGNTEMLEWIMRRLELMHRADLLKATDKEGRTLLHVAAENANLDMVRCILDLLDTTDFKFNLLWTQDNRKQTALHYAARINDNFSSKKAVLGPADKLRRNKTTVEYMLNSVKAKERLALLQRQDCDGNTALHEAVRMGNTQSIRRIVKSVKQNAQHLLQGIRNSHGHTASSTSSRMRLPPISASTEFLPSYTTTLDSIESDEVNFPIQIEGSDDGTSWRSLVSLDDSYSFRSLGYFNEYGEPETDQVNSCREDRLGNEIQIDELKSWRVNNNIGSEDDTLVACKPDNFVEMESEMELLKEVTEMMETMNSSSGESLPTPSNLHTFDSQSMGNALTLLTPTLTEEGHAMELMKGLQSNINGSAAATPLTRSPQSLEGEFTLTPANTNRCNRNARRLTRQGRIDTPRLNREQLVAQESGIDLLKPYYAHENHEDGSLLTESAMSMRPVMSPNPTDELTITAIIHEPAEEREGRVPRSSFQGLRGPDEGSL